MKIKGHFDHDDIQKLRDDNERLKAELEFHAWQVSPGMAQAKLDELNREVERLKSDNARLAAVYSLLRDALMDTKPRAELGSEAWHLCENKRRDAFASCETTALSTLLAPTVELLEELRQYTHAIPTTDEPDPVTSAINKELARLRAACGEGKEKT